MVRIKRKVIQIANSTQLISLPRKWSQKHGVKKGDEIDIEEEGDKLIISTDGEPDHKEITIDADKWNFFLPRVIHALYKKGIDEIRINFSNPELLRVVQKSLGKETVGFELLDQGKDYCIIKNVSGDLEDFDSVLRRTFLVLLQMAQESYEAVKNGNYSHLTNVAFLEESNNRFTTTCRRLLNKKGYNNYQQVGPMYYIIEELEKIADHYKYMCKDISNMDPKKNKVSKEMLGMFNIVSRSLQLFYEVFYKFDENKVVEIAGNRKNVVDKKLHLLKNKNSAIDFTILHHQTAIMEGIFCLTGPFLVLVL